MSSYFWESFWDGYAAHWQMPYITGNDRIFRMESYCEIENLKVNHKYVALIHDGHMTICCL